MLEKTVIKQHQSFRPYQLLIFTSLECDMEQPAVEGWNLQYKEWENYHVKLHIIVNDNMICAHLWI